MRRRPGIRGRCLPLCSPPWRVAVAPGRGSATGACGARRSRRFTPGASSRSRGPTRTAKPGTAQPDAALLHGLRVVRVASLAADEALGPARGARDRDGVAALGGRVLAGRRPAPLSEGGSRAIRLRERQRGALPGRVLAGRCAGLATLDAVARARSLARRRGRAVTARSARPESRLAAGLRARARALPRAGRRSARSLLTLLTVGAVTALSLGRSCSRCIRAPGTPEALASARPRSSSRRCSSLPPVLPRGGSSGAGRGPSGAASASPARARRLPPRDRAGGGRTGRLARDGSRSATGSRMRPRRPVARRLRRVRAPADPGSGSRQLRSATRANGTGVRSRSIRTASCGGTLGRRGSWERVSSSAFLAAVAAALRLDRSRARGRSAVAALLATGSRMDRSTGSGRCLRSPPRLSPASASSRAWREAPPVAVRRGRGLALRGGRPLAGGRRSRLRLPALAARRDERAVRVSAGSRRRIRPARAGATAQRPQHRRGRRRRRSRAASGDLERASQAFRRALGRDPTDWYPASSSASIDLQAGRAKRRRRSSSRRGA